MADKKIYMIRNKKNGLYSTGYYRGHFTSNMAYAKMWTSFQGVRNHLTSFLRQKKIKTWNRETRKWEFNGGEFFKLDNPYLEAEIVEIQLNHTPVQEVYPFILETEKKKQPKGRKKKVKNGEAATGT